MPLLPLLSVAVAIGCAVVAARTSRARRGPLRHPVVVHLASAAAWTALGAIPDDAARTPLAAGAAAAATWATVAAGWYVVRAATDPLWRPRPAAAWAWFAVPQVLAVATALLLGPATVLDVLPAVAVESFPAAETWQVPRIGAAAVALVVVARLSVAHLATTTASRRSVGSLRIAAALPLVATLATVVRPDALGQTDLVPFAFAVGALLQADVVARRGFAVLVPPPARRVLDALHEEVVVLDEDGRVADANQAAVRLVGVPVDELAGRPARLALPEYLRAAMVGGAVVRVESTPGSFREVRADALLGPAGEPLGAVVTARDVTRLVAAQRVLERDRRRLVEQNGHVLDALTQAERHRRSLAEDASRDPLTGVHNRRGLEPAITEAMGMARATGAVVAVLVLDLDHFKAVNDTHGHGVGDRVLQAMATTLLAEGRPGESVVRYGGEEFVVVLMASTVVEALRRADELKERIASLRIPLRGEGGDGEGSLGVTASIGVSCFPEHGDTVAELLTAADQSLYAAKAAGRNCVVMA